MRKIFRKLKCRVALIAIDRRYDRCASKGFFASYRFVQGFSFEQLSPITPMP